MVVKLYVAGCAYCCLNSVNLHFAFYVLNIFEHILLVIFYRLLFLTASCGAMVHAYTENCLIRRFRFESEF